MALVHYSPIIEELVGSVDGWTFSRVRSGHATKSKSFPGSVNPFTPSANQMTLRAYFQKSIQEWKSLSAEQIQAWIDLAKQLPRSGRFGFNYYSAGYNLYLECNQRRQILLQSILTDAPDNPHISGLSAITLVTNPVSNFMIIASFADQTTAADVSHFVFSTPDLSAGRTYYKNFYRLISFIPPSTVDAFDLTADYLSFFSTPPENRKIAVRVIPVHIPSGLDARALTAETITYEAQP